MENRARLFELAILRPLLVAILIAAAIFLFRGMWWWLGGCVLASLYLVCHAEALFQD